MNLPLQMCNLIVFVLINQVSSLSVITEILFGQSISLNGPSEFTSSRKKKKKRNDVIYCK